MQIYCPICKNFKDFKKNDKQKEYDLVCGHTVPLFNIKYKWD
jgi:hypothetical protein